MTDSRPKCAVLRWSNLSEPSDAAPGYADRLAALGLNQRVVSVDALYGEWADIRYGEHSFTVRQSCLQFVDESPFQVGSLVQTAGGVAIVRDIIWHFNESRPNYYLSRDGKKLSKRFSGADLTPA